MTIDQQKELLALKVLEMGKQSVVAQMNPEEQ